MHRIAEPSPEALAPVFASPRLVADAAAAAASRNDGDASNTPFDAATRDRSASAMSGARQGGGEAAEKHRTRRASRVSFRWEREPDKWLTELPPYSAADAAGGGDGGGGDNARRSRASRASRASRDGGESDTAMDAFLESGAAMAAMLVPELAGPPPGAPAGPYDDE